MKKDIDLVTIRVQRTTRAMLKKRGFKGTTYDDIILNLLKRTKGLK